MTLLMSVRCFKYYNTLLHYAQQVVYQITFKYSVWEEGISFNVINEICLKIDPLSCIETKKGERVSLTYY